MSFTCAHGAGRACPEAAQLQSEAPRGKPGGGLATGRLLTHLVEVVGSPKHSDDSRVDCPVALHDNRPQNEEKGRDVDIVELQLSEVVRQGLKLGHLAAGGFVLQRGSGELEKVEGEEGTFTLSRGRGGGEGGQAR